MTSKEYKFWLDKISRHVIGWFSFAMFDYPQVPIHQDLRWAPRFEVGSLKSWWVTSLIFGLAASKCSWQPRFEVGTSQVLWLVVFEKGLPAKIWGGFGFLEKSSNQLQNLVGYQPKFVVGTSQVFWLVKFGGFSSWHAIFHFCWE